MKLGTKHSIETRRKMTESHKGKVLSKRKNECSMIFQMPLQIRKDFKKHCKRRGMSMKKTIILFMEKKVREDAKIWK